LELRELNVNLTAAQYEPPPFDKAVMKLATLDKEKQAQLALLEEYESRYLIRKAQSWGIEVSYRQEWYTLKDRNDDPGTSGDRAVLLLNEAGKAAITKQIRNEQFAYWKHWAEILIPILSLIVAIIALSK